MSLYNLTNATTPDDILVGVSTSIPVFPIMLLVFVWFIVFIGGSQRQTARYGYADVPQWAVLASMSVFLLSLMMTVIGGIISLQTLVVVVAITILTGIWFFMSKGRIE